MSVIQGEHNVGDATYTEVLYLSTQEFGEHWDQHGGRWLNVRVPLDRDHIAELIAYMDWVESGSERFPSAGPVHANWPYHNMTLFNGVVPSGGNELWRYERFKMALGDVQPRIEEIDGTIHKIAPGTVGRHPGDMPTPDLVTERYEDGREVVYGESVEWKLRQRGHTPAIYAGKVRRELLEEIDAKLTCYEANGQQQAEELDRLREEEPDLHEEMMKECRELLVTTGTTGGRLPVHELFRHVEEPTEEELQRLMSADHKEVRQRGIRLAAKLGRPPPPDAPDMPE